MYVLPDARPDGFLPGKNFKSREASPMLQMIKLLYVVSHQTAAKRDVNLHCKVSQ